jgi:hypothetical protein
MCKYQKDKPQPKTLPYPRATFTSECGFLFCLFGVIRRSEQLVCDACQKYKQTNTLEDCKCGKGQMWVKKTNCS